MAWRCSICSKGSMAGKTISHSHRATNRRFLPNLHRARVLFEGRVQSLKVCTRCIKSQRVTKAGPRLVAA